MGTANMLDQIVDPVEALNATLERAWAAVSKAYDVSACLPDMQTLFCGADLSRPNQAAESVLAAMLLEVVECTGRFSPWYKLPARAFGLASVRASGTNRPAWVLGPEAIHRWQALLQPLAQTVRKYGGLIQAMILVDDLMQDLPGDPCVTAKCGCQPPKSIQIRRSVIEKTEITCQSCLQPFV
jgi:hypothetical protein